MSQLLKAPFPWFGGKSRAADLIWSRFGAVQNYVEPFAGSLAVLLQRPGQLTTETVNDLDGLLVNFWRAVRAAPELVALHADWPVSELDLHARHAVLVEARAELTERLQADPDHYDARLAGWWAWGACCWIGSGWCSGKGPWQRVETPDGLRLLKTESSGAGTVRKLPRLSGFAETGINRQLTHLADAGTGINRQLPMLSYGGATRDGEVMPNATQWLQALSARLRRVRVACGDWQRVTGPSVTTKHGLTGLLLDPPYDDAGAENDCYGVAHTNVAEQVRAWALANGTNPLLRIALCSYGDAPLLAGWTRERWKPARAIKRRTAKGVVMRTAKSWTFRPTACGRCVGSSMSNEQ